ncbi:MAG: class I SAM-dependent methyltransferase, partial [Rickettsiales bacterium]|nr:class I SAM-dependent methyltransferase [Rickettsiales bacterium]
MSDSLLWYLFEKNLRQLDSNFSFFDAGGGTGRWSIKVLENFPESSGVIYDLSVEMLEEARKKIVARKGLEKKLKMVIGNLENLQLGSFQKFDLVFCFHNV